MAIPLHSARHLSAGIALALTLVLTAGCNTNPDTPADVLSVAAVAADPSALTGRIAVKGIVQSVDQTGGVISIIDETEYATCGLTPCGSAALIPLHVPTKGEPSPGGGLYAGTLPEPEDLVVVVGEIASSPQGLYFDVERVERGGTSLIARQ